MDTYQVSLVSARPKGEEYFSAFWRKASRRAIKAKTKKLNRCVPVVWNVERVEMLISCRSSNVSV